MEHDGIRDIAFQSAEIEHGVLELKQQNRLRDTDCIVCSALMNIGSLVSVTSCGHAIHYVHLLQHLIRQTICPLCRHQLQEAELVIPDQADHYLRISRRLIHQHNGVLSRELVRYILYGENRQADRNIE